MKKLLLTTIILFSIFKVEAQCPPIPYTGNSATITCSNPVASIPLSTTVSPVSCVWDNNPNLMGSNTLNPFTNTPGIYSFTLTNTSNGCTTAGSATVYLDNFVPSAMISSSSNTICIGQTDTLTASSTSPVSYSWAPSTGLSSTTNSLVYASPFSNTVYTVTVSDMTNGCFTTVSINIIVTQNFQVTVNSQSVCASSSATLTAFGANSYTWSTGATTNSIVITPTISTNYTVTGASCVFVATKTATVTVDQTCQDVWPGDANSDGIADNLDVLELGLHFAQTGAARASTSNNWQSYFANNWTGTITNGKNLNHSDCNGDGTIDNDDTLAIYNNYGLNHAFKTAQTTTVNPQLNIVPDQTMVAKGTWGSASIYLGDATTSVNNINGIAFTVNFDNTLIEPNSIYIEYQNSFMDLSNQNLDFRKLNFATGKIYTATTHTVNSNVSGYGKIATLHYQILSSLTTDQVLNFSLVQANLSNALGTITPLTSGASTLIASVTGVGLQEIIDNNLVSINPNPTNGLLTVTSKTELQKIEVVTITGQILMSEIPTGNNHLLHLDNFSNGIYFVNLFQNNCIIKREKIVINK